VSTGSNVKIIIHQHLQELDILEQCRMLCSQRSLDVCLDSIDVVRIECPAPWP
jgi:hypothetical protein